MAGGGKRAGAGRKKGSGNKVNLGLKAAFQKHDTALVKALIALTKSDDENVRLKAVQACLDRGHGKPPQSVEVGVDDETITKIVREIVGSKNPNG